MVGAPWWAHFEFTRINIEPIILRKKIEDVREARAWTLPREVSVVTPDLVGAPRPMSLAVDRGRTVFA